MGKISKALVLANLLVAILAACSESDYREGVNYILVGNKNIYINRSGDEFKIINKETGESVAGRLVFSDDASVKNTLDPGFIQIRFNRSAFGLPEEISLQYTGGSPYFCSGCPDGKKYWQLRK